MEQFETEDNKGKNKRYPKPVYFTEEENRLIRVAALVNEASVSSFIHDCTMKAIEARRDEYEMICSMIKTKEE